MKVLVVARGGKMRSCNLKVGSQKRAGNEAQTLRGKGKKGMIGGKK